MLQNYNTTLKCHQKHRSVLAVSICVQTYQ